MKYERKRLGDYIDILPGYAFKSNTFSEVGIPIIKIKNIIPPYVDLKDTSFVPKEEADAHSKFYLKYNDVLIALTGSHINQMASVVGRVARVKYNYPSLLNQRVGKITVKNPEICDINYVYYFLSQESIKIALASKAGGAANQANISPSDVKNLMIPFPDVDIQHRIAETLSAYDDLIENNQNQIKLLEEAAQRFYKEWFIDLRFPGYKETTTVGGIPCDWKNDTIDSFTDLLSGFAFKSQTFNNSGRYKIVTIKNVQNGQFDSQNVSRIDEIPPKLPSHCYLADGDILLSLTGNVGRVCMVIGNDFLLNQRVAKLQSKYKAFTYCLFKSNDMYILMNNLANGAAQQNLSPVRTGKIAVRIPSEELLLKFEDMTLKFINKIIALNKQNNLLLQARDRLLPKLMSGELEV